MNKLQRLLIKHEGYRTMPYEDTSGNLTIGVGRNLDSIGLSDDEVVYMLDNDIARCDRELLDNFSWYSSLNRCRQDAMINLCFNLGITRLKKFKKALASMSQADYRTAAYEFLDSKWATQVGKSRSTDVTFMIRYGQYPKDL